MRYWIGVALAGAGLVLALLAVLDVFPNTILAVTGGLVVALIGALITCDWSDGREPVEQVPGKWIVTGRVSEHDLMLAPSLGIMSEVQQALIQDASIGDEITTWEDQTMRGLAVRFPVMASTRENAIRVAVRRFDQLNLMLLHADAQPKR